MAYRGGMYNEFEKLSKKTFNFLKKCMRKIPKNFPVRGPKRLKSGKWRYENNWRGSIGGFIGEEKIYHDGKEVYLRNYLGGLIKNKK